MLEGISIILPSAACFTSVTFKNDLVVPCGSNVTRGCAVGGALFGDCLI